MTTPDADRPARIKRMTAAGMTAPQIATALGISTRTVQRHREKTGCAQPAPTPLTPEQLAHAETLLHDGCSIKEVARTIGCGQYTIRRHFPGSTGWPHQQCGAFTSESKRLQQLERQRTHPAPRPATR